jgi:hypothetical protein
MNNISINTDGVAVSGWVHWPELWYVVDVGDIRIRIKPVLLIRTIRHAAGLDQVPFTSPNIPNRIRSLDDERSSSCKEVATEVSSLYSFAVCVVQKEFVDCRRGIRYFLMQSEDTAVPALVERDASPVVDVIVSLCCVVCDDSS